MMMMMRISLRSRKIEKKSSVNTGQGKLIEPGALYIRKIICSDLAPMEIMTVVGDSNDPYVKLRRGIRKSSKHKRHK